MVIPAAWPTGTGLSVPFVPVCLLVSLPLASEPSLLGLYDPLSPRQN